MLAALGLTALVLAPWLTYKQAFLQAIVIGVNLFAVARLTKAVAPLHGAADRRRARRPRGAAAA